MDFEREIIFVDCYGFCGRTNSVVTLFFGPSKIEGIPLGVVFHTSQTKENYLCAFKVLK